MAQVGVQQPTNLMEMFSSPSMMLGDIASQQVNDQTLGNLINRQQAAQSMDIERQKLPFELAQLGLQNQEAQARIPGVQADSGLKQNNFKIDTANLDARTKADLAKKLADISDSDWTQHVNALQQGMIDPSPRVRAASTMIYNNLPDITKMRAKALEERQTSMDVETLRGSNARQLEEQAAAHGKYKRPDKYGLSFTQRLANENDPVKKITMLNSAYQEALIEANKTTDPNARADLLQVASEYSQIAKSIESVAQAKLNQNPKPGTVDIGTQAGVATNPTQPLVPATPSTEKEQAVQLTPQDQLALTWARANPNDPRAIKILQKLKVSK